MRNNKHTLLALSLMFFAPAFSFSQQPDIASSVLEKITVLAAGSFGLPSDFQVPEKIPAGTAEAVKLNSGSEEKALAPRPGKDLAPVVEDQVRIKAILKLVADIYNGAHLPYSQDGATFSNKEKGLPARPHGFYKEYTLLTGDAPHTVTIGGITYQVAPDLSARGSERLIIGGGEKVYYTPDHYKSYIELTMVY